MSSEFRDRAEAQLRNTDPADLADMSGKDLQTLVRELQVRQIELEMQNKELRRAQAELAESERRLALAVSGTRIGIFEQDLGTGDVLATEQNARLLGIRSSASAGSTLSVQYHYSDWTRRVHPDDLPALEAEIARCKANLAPLDAEYRVVWPDESVHHLAVRGAFQPDGSPAEGARRLLGVHMDLTDYRRLRRELDTLTRDWDQTLDERTSELRQMAVRLDEAQDRERQRIAAGLHNEVAQTMAAGQIKIAEAQGVSDPGERNGLLDEADSLITDAADEIQGLTFELSSASLFAEGFVAAVRELCAHMTRRYGVRFHLEAPETTAPVPRHMLSALYHAVRELLYNVTKHAGVDEAKVCIEETGGPGLRVTVHDEGKGFDAMVLDRPLTREGGFGLRHIRERLRSLGVSLQVRSVPGDGVEAVIEVPLG